MSLKFEDGVFNPNSMKLLHATPWSVFEDLWMATMGYPVDEFKVIPGITPLTTFRETATAIALYYTIILTGRELMRRRPAFKFNDLFLVHNLFLTVISGTLLVLFVDQLVPTIWKHGLFFSVCGSGGWTRQLETLYYLNYLTKYVELADTVFLVLKKKPLTFLHCYHHGATALLCYTQLIGRTPVSWVPITLNLAVHVVMYWYYFQSARKIRISWKEWITRLQIIQFVVDLGFIYYATYNYYASEYLPILPHVGTCAGEEFAAFTGCAILSSYLVLFISFYYATYRKSGKNDKGTATTAVMDLEMTRIPNMSETSEKATEVFKAVNGAVKAKHITIRTSHVDGN